jgi:hypothetical protein
MDLLFVMSASEESIRRFAAWKAGQSPTGFFAALRMTGLLDAL